MHSHRWRQRSRLQYDIYLKRYWAFCNNYYINPLLQIDTSVIEFLTEIYHDGYGYSLFNLGPPWPRNTIIWNVSVKLNYLRFLSPASKLKMLTLSAKLVTLCALVTGHRCQTLIALNIYQLAFVKLSSCVSYRRFT